MGNGMNKPKRTTKNMRAIGRLGGLATRAGHSPEEYCAAGLRAANSLDRFLSAVPADLPESERISRALAARSLFYAKIGRRGGKARGRWRTED
jgi:hypothetical protein